MNNVIVPKQIPLLCMAAMSALLLAVAQPASAAQKILVELHVKKADVVVPPHGSKYLDDFSEGGQFEILLKPASVPVSAPMCRKSIIARMPWTDSSDAGADAVIASKKALFDKFEALKKGEIEVVDVTVDATPYGKLVSESPRVVKLSYCNVFFLSPKP
ncbi:MAG: hypothetical protein V4764_21430 [Burkholderia sp.]